MQSNKFNVPAAGAVSMPCSGSGFWYESGTSSTSNQYIIVKPSTGGTEMRLKPGQNVRGLPGQGFWTITAEDPTATITGYAIIGDGDFNDDNTANLVTINASAVLNSQALPVQKQALSTITTFVPVVIGTGAAQALVSDATQRVLRIKNTHASANVALGGSTVTMANAAVILPAGAVWIEEEGAGAAWYATSDTASTTVTVQGLKL